MAVQGVSQGGMVTRGLIELVSVPQRPPIFNYVAWVYGARVRVMPVWSAGAGDACLEYHALLPAPSTHTLRLTLPASFSGLCKVASLEFRTAVGCTYWPDRCLLSICVAHDIFVDFFAHPVLRCCHSEQQPGGGPFAGDAALRQSHSRHHCAGFVLARYVFVYPSFPLLPHSYLSCSSCPPPCFLLLPLASFCPPTSPRVLTPLAAAAACTDPYHLSTYLDKCEFLPVINNEATSHPFNATFRNNFLALKVGSFGDCGSHVRRTQCLAAIQPV